jgi:hypothetical protein
MQFCPSTVRRSSNFPIVKPFGVFDVETDPFKAGRMPKPFLAAFYDGSRCQVWRGSNCVEQAFKVMRRFRGYIYAHNGGKFDFKFLLPLVPKRDLRLFTIKGRIAKIAFGDVEFRDSYLMLPVPLKAYGKTEIEYWKFEDSERHKWIKEITEYLKADCYYLYEMVKEFVNDYGFGLTMAGRTFAQLKEKFDINPPKTNEHYDAKFREFYYGGRVQFFELGHIKGKFNIYDINSAYPFAMVHRHVFGSGFISATVAPSKESILSQCFVRFMGRGIGLPYRSADGSLSFEAHRGVYSVTGWELVQALKTNAVKIDKVIQCHRPTELRDFEPYVTHFYRMKKAAKKGTSEELFAKLMLNSCYGRFALNPREFRDVCMTEYGDEPDENYQAKKKGEEPPWELANDFEDSGVSIWEKPSRQNSNAFFNVATAASITGFVRAYLARALSQVERPVYCDTDSIICGGGESLTVGANLGNWKHEGTIAKDSLWIAGKKLYAAKCDDGKWKYASKGVRLAPGQICQIAEGTPITSTLEAPTFSLLTGERFITRTVRRDDQRKRKKTNA